MKTSTFWFVMVLAAAASHAGAQIDSIVNSKHNLSAGGPGTVRAATEQEICVFCHTPHNASPVQPLWNRNIPVSAYNVYSSTSLHAKPGQPTGSSKLCLSCHDGTIALGSVLSRTQAIEMAAGVTTLPPGATNLGTDLSDDHPISFKYDLDLVSKNPKLTPPQNLPAGMHLDSNFEMQCTTCHEPHNNANGSFLVMNNQNSQLCKTCHQQGTTDAPAHDQCAACHTPHTAPSKAWLLKQPTISDTCVTCHSGQPGPNQGSNVLAELNQVDRHDTHSATSVALGTPGAVGCADCHEPHTMKGTVATAPILSGKFGAIDGVNSAGAAVARAQFEYEVCYKCHADRNTVTPVTTRQLVQNNVRLQFAASAVSSHPVETAGKNINVPSLRPGLTTASVIYCGDCHGSDLAQAAGGASPNGPHGSNNRPLLLARYDTTDNTPESSAAYALCYTCHDRSSILSDQSFKHKTHVVDKQTPCSVCHDAHGISSAQGTVLHNAALVNFDVTVVRPDPNSGKIEYTSQGAGHGNCTLSCHGTTHSARAY